MPEAALVEICPITLASPADFQRCFLSVTIGSIVAWKPDPPPPPGPGSWSLTFERDVPDGDSWESAPYNPSSYPDTTISHVEWSGFAEYSGIGFWQGIERDNGLDWERWLEMWTPTGNENPDPPLGLDRRIRLSLMPTTESAYLRMTLNSPTGSTAEDVIISG